MAASSLRTLAILMVVMVGTLVCNNEVVMVSGQCGGSVPDLFTQCGPYVQKTGPEVPPSPACCTELRKFDPNCACKLVTPEFVNLINVTKAIYVARFCGLNVPPGYQCGVITVPGRR